MKNYDLSEFNVTNKDFYGEIDKLIIKRDKINAMNFEKLKMDKKLNINPYEEIIKENEAYNNLSEIEKCEKKVTENNDIYLHRILISLKEIKESGREKYAIDVIIEFIKEHLINTSLETDNAKKIENCYNKQSELFMILMIVQNILKYGELDSSLYKMYYKDEYCNKPENKYE